MICFYFATCKYSLLNTSLRGYKYWWAMNLKKWILTVMFVKGLLSLKFIQYRSLEDYWILTSRQTLFLQMSTNFNKVCWLLETFNFFIRPHSPFKHTELLRRKFMIYHWLSYWKTSNENIFWMKLKHYGLKYVWRLNWMAVISIWATLRMTLRLHINIDV